MLLFGLEVKLHYGPSCSSVGRLVGLSVMHNFLKGQGVSLSFLLLGALVS